MAHTELDLREGRAIEDMVNAKMPVPEIADRLGCAPSTVYRELQRNFWANDAFPKKYAGYFGHAAQLQTNKRRSVQQIPPYRRLPARRGWAAFMRGLHAGGRRAIG